MDRQERYAWDSYTKMWYKWSYANTPVTIMACSDKAFQYFVGYWPRRFVLISREMQRYDDDVLCFYHIDPDLSGPANWFYAPTKYRRITDEISQT